jgi:predicted transposase/invertase (TIGR01784 family)
MKSFLYQFQLAHELKRLALHNARSGKHFSLMDDVVFKTMFTTDSEDSKEALRQLLSACTRREVAAVQIMNTELNPVYLGGKSPRLDIHVSFNDGETANLEMQMGKSNDDLRKRAIVYTNLLVAGQSKKGDTYEAAKRAYQIFFLNDVLYPKSKKVPRRYFYMEEDEHDRLSDLTEILFYELPKLKHQVQEFLAGKLTIKNLPKDTRWCIYFRYRFDKRAETLIEQMCREDGGIMRAEKALAKVDKDYVKWARTMAKIKDKMDYASKMLRFEREIEANAIARWKREGRAEGLAEGKMKGKLEIVSKLKAAGMPLEEICNITGLSPETVEKG